MGVEVRDWREGDTGFVGRCTHGADEEAFAAAAPVRLGFLESMGDDAVVKVAWIGGAPHAVIHAFPGESLQGWLDAPGWLVIPCLTLRYQGVRLGERGSGAGRALVEAVELEARRRGCAGLATIGCEGDFWFMPAGFFRRLGFREVERRGEEVVMVRTAGRGDAPPPRFLRPRHPDPPPAAGGEAPVTVDLFWNPFCVTSIIERDNVRNACARFEAGAVRLREYDFSDPAVCRLHQQPRGLYVGGERFDWGYSAPAAEVARLIRERLGR